MALVKIYDNDNSTAKDFFLSYNGVNVQGQIGVEIDLDDNYIAVLEDACISTEYPDGNGGVKKERKPRFAISYVRSKAEVKQAEPVMTTKVYTCEECGEEFDHHLKLAGHKKTHKD
jgi:hypothetical protein